MATDDLICRERRNDRKEEDEDSDGDSKQIEGGARKDRVSLSSKADVLFRRLDEPLVNTLQDGLQEKKKPGGRHGRESRRARHGSLPQIWWRGGRRQRQQGNGAGREGNLGTDTGLVPKIAADVSDSAGGSLSPGCDGHRQPRLSQGQQWRC